MTVLERDSLRKRKKKRLNINTTCCKYDIVRECSKSMGYKDVDDSEPWSLFWIDTGVSVERILEMHPIQKINHFPGMQEICRKDYLARNLSRLNRMFPRDYNFSPKTWTIPYDWTEFKMAVQSKKHGVYIAKPDHGCQGKGIFLFKNIKDLLVLHHVNAQNNPTAPVYPSVAIKKSLLSDTFIPSNMIIQTYVARPLLIDGFKFDLRVYALVTSVDPLRIFIYEDGLARFATDKYETPSSSNLSNVFMHLTNYAINKHSDKFDRNEQTGSKRTIKTVLNDLEKKGIDVEKLWGRISDVIVKTVITIQPQLRKILGACFRKNANAAGSTGSTQSLPHSDTRSIETLSPCFEILGFDIFVDNKLKPWLLEVNHSPSFSCDSNLDLQVKKNVITDCMRLVSADPKTMDKFIKNQKEETRTRLLNNASHVKLTKDGSTETLKSPESKSKVSLTASPRVSKTSQESLRASKTSQASPRVSKTSQDSSQSTASSARKNGRKSKKLSPEQIEEKILAYKAEYPTDLLQVLTEYEDERMGGYKRAFPPTDPAKLAEYLVYMETANDLFGETLASKGRKEYLKKKREEEAKKEWQTASWRKKVGKVTRSNQSLVDAKDAYDRADHPNPFSPNAEDVFTSNELMYEEDKKELDEQERTQSLQTEAILKTPLKLNVESLNVRFHQSLLHQEAIGKRLMENSPTAVHGPIPTKSILAHETLERRKTQPHILPASFKARLKKLVPQRAFPAHIEPCMDEIKLDMGGTLASADLRERLVTTSSSLQTLSSTEEALTDLLAKVSKRPPPRSIRTVGPNTMRTMKMNGMLLGQKLTI